MSMSSCRGPMTCLTGQANAMVALGNFRTALALSNAHTAVEMIDAALGGNADRLKQPRPQRYGIVVLDGDGSCSESRT